MISQNDASNRYPATEPEHIGEGSPVHKAAHHTTQPMIRPGEMNEMPTLSELFEPPIYGAGNPSTTNEGTSPGSFALKADIGGPRMFSSPDTPGMPQPSEKTAWDFLPEGWTHETLPLNDCTDALINTNESASGEAVFADARGAVHRVSYPEGFSPITQLESARLGIVTPEMVRVSQREPHLTSEQVRDEIAAGRLIIPANVNHLKHQLDPMAIGRASKTKVNANMGASPISSGTDEELEKLRWAERWAGDTVIDRKSVV